VVALIPTELDELILSRLGGRMLFDYAPPQLARICGRRPLLLLGAAQKLARGRRQTAENTSSRRIIVVLFDVLDRCVEAVRLDPAVFHSPTFPRAAVRARLSLWGPASRPPIRHPRRFE